MNLVFKNIYCLFKTTKRFHRLDKNDNNESIWKHCDSIELTDYEKLLPCILF